MSADQSTPTGSKNKNVILWGCIAAIVLWCLFSCCLITFAGFALFSEVDLFGLDSEEWFDDMLPWEDFFDDPSFEYDLPESYDEGDNGEDLDTSEEPSEPMPISGIGQLVQFQSDQFSFSFFYPEGWYPEEDENNESVVFLDPNSDTFLGVGRDWLCQGCSTAADVSAHFMVDIEFEAQPDTLVMLEDMPYSVSTGEDAHFNAYEWIDLDGEYNWIYDLVIYVEDPVEDTSIYFVLWGFDTQYYEEYRELFEKIIMSYSK
jgi:hypothetical protein